MSDEDGECINSEGISSDMLINGIFEIFLLKGRVSHQKCTFIQSNNNKKRVCTLYHVLPNAKLNKHTEPSIFLFCFVLTHSRTRSLNLACYASHTFDCECILFLVSSLASFVCFSSLSFQFCMQQNSKKYKYANCMNTM